MPSLELAAGQVLTAAHTNTYWMRQVVATGLSSARPTGYEGRVIYDTDTDSLMVYTTATTGWRPPWNLPWGRAGSAINSSFDQAGSGTTLVAIPSLSFTVNEVAGRRYRAICQSDVYSDAAGDSVALHIVRAGVGLGRALTKCPVANESGVAHTFMEYTATVTGPVTWDARISRIVGTGVPHAIAIAGVPTTLIVEDIGPATSPP